MYFCMIMILPGLLIGVSMGHFTSLIRMEKKIAFREEYLPQINPFISESSK